MGLVELTAAEKLTATLGMEGHETLIRLCGVRELASGFGILTSADKEPWLRARAGGDALDIGTLIFALHEGNPRRDNARLALMAVAGVTVLDVWCAGKRRGRGRLSKRSRPTAPAMGFPEACAALPARRGISRLPPTCALRRRCALMKHSPFRSQRFRDKPPGFFKTPQKGLTDF